MSSSGKCSASDHCPAYKVSDQIASAVREKLHRDEVQTAELISRGTPAAPVKMGVDGICTNVPDVLVRVLTGV